MRVTAQAKEATRDRILETARKLFSTKGFDPTTTRDLAREAGIATGTLFNYFASKEAVAMTLIADQLDGVQATAVEERSRGQSLEEDLFAHVAEGLRRLRPFRSFVGPVLEAMISPFSRSSCCEASERLRLNHMETVGNLIAVHRPSSSATFVAVHLYWTLYLGVLAFWSNDESPHQEDTLVVLDQSLRLFAASLAQNSSRTEVNRGS